MMFSLPFTREQIEEGLLWFYVPVTLTWLLYHQVLLSFSLNKTEKTALRVGEKLSRSKQEFVKDMICTLDDPWYSTNGFLAWLFRNTYSDHRRAGIVYYDKKSSRYKLLNIFKEPKV